MPIETHKHDGSVWREMTEIAYRDAGIIRDLTEMHYNDAGTWRQVFGAAPASNVILDNQNILDVVLSPSPASITYQLTTDGRAQSTDGGLPTNLTPDNWWALNPVASVGDDYEARATQTGSTGASSDEGEARNVWLPITVLRGWGINKGSVGTADQTLLIEIRDIATMTLQDSCTVILNVEVTV